MRLTLARPLAGPWTDALNAWLAEQPELAAELAHATLEEELEALAACGLLEETWAAVREMRELVAEGRGILPAHHAGALLLFHALGLNPRNPLDEGVDDVAHLGARPLEMPLWTWFAGEAGPARVIAVPELGGLTMEQVRDACVWSPATREALRRHRARAHAGDAWPCGEAPEVPETWHKLILQRAGASPGPGDVPKYRFVLERDRRTLRADEDSFFETGGIPVFEDQLLHFAETLSGGDCPVWRWRFRSLVRGALRDDNRDALRQMPILPEIFAVLAHWGPTTMPRTAAIAEARLEMVAAWRRTGND